MQLPAAISVRRVLRWLVVMFVLAFVTMKGWQLWSAGSASVAVTRPWWIVPAAFASVAGWVPSVWCLRALLNDQGYSLPVYPVLRAYFCGHLGKYVPGKAAAVAIRSGMLSAAGVAVRDSAIAATVETLGVMGIGVAVMLALGAWVFPESASDSVPQSVRWILHNRWLGPLTVIPTVILTIPLAARLANLVAVRLARSFPDSNAAEGGATGVRAAVSGRRLAQASAAFVPGWLLHGLSCGCLVIAIDAGSFSLENWMLWTAATAGATSIGFLVLLTPGGVGIKEGIMTAALSPAIGAPEAVAVAVLHRLLTFLTEVVVGAVLYLRPPRHGPPAKPQQPDC